MLTKDCNIFIHIDGGAPPVLDASEPITGTVEVEVGEEVTCGGLVLTQRWETHGKGDRDTGTGHRTVLFEGEWEPGQTYSYPFEMELPPGPYSHRGRYISIDWHLEAEADIPWSLDPSTTADFVLEPGGREGFDPGETTARAFLQNQPDDHESGTVTKIVLGLVFLAAGVGVTYVSVTAASSILGTLFGLAFAAGGLVALYSAVQNYFAEMRLGDVEVETIPTEIVPGDDIEVVFRMTPEQSVSVEEAVVEIEGKESATYQRGTDTYTYTETLHSERAVPADSKRAHLTAGDRTEFRTTMSFPESAPYTFEADDNEFVWRIKYRVDVPDWPDWSHTHKLLVRPPADDPLEVSTAEDNEPSTGEESDEAYAQTW